MKKRNPPGKQSSRPKKKSANRSRSVKTTARSEPLRDEELTAASGGITGWYAAAAARQEKAAHDASAVLDGMGKTMDMMHELAKTDARNLR